MENTHCVIEHHAALYGFLAKRAVEKGLESRRALAKATYRYGLERGMRMADYAEAEGLEKTMETYSLFKEWRPPLLGQNIPGDSVKQPHYITSVARCEWAETWKKYGLTSYAKTYCLYVDKALVKGFNPHLELDIPANLSFGDAYCEFDWGYSRTPEVDQQLKELGEKIGTKYVRNFDFHTAHLYTCISRVLRDELGDIGEEISREALVDFREVFGEAYVNTLKEEARLNHWEFIGE